ncbi:uncharacterized protein C8R40DRAFT_1169724 [Lentinula edodes]|uniref:uncharacterized protein n=1 Tax=Lentinula edodes TaxID=5353 RepID=UPI001E8E7896|nr:uncharacterized protein C8R40DRAFT_1169724 [Lentinula edodes]KAH7876072.1 hypothetical protein C8R40DRAFT_1169724 [Lentinula edodes]
METHSLGSNLEDSEAELLRAQRTLETLQIHIENETENQLNSENAGVLSTIRDLEDSEKKLTSIVDRASHAMQILAAESELPEAYAAKENLILSVAIQTEVIRALEMQLALPERLLHPDIIDLKWLTEVVQDTNDDDTCKDAKLETLRRLQTASADTLSHVFEWLADVM